MQRDLGGIDAREGSCVRFRFSAVGRASRWTFSAAKMDERVAPGLAGRPGGGRDVYVDAARVTFHDGCEGKPDTVSVAIGARVRRAAAVARVRGAPPAECRGLACQRAWRVGDAGMGQLSRTSLLLDSKGSPRLESRSRLVDSSRKPCRPCRLRPAKSPAEPAKIRIHAAWCGESAGMPGWPVMTSTGDLACPLPR